MMSVKILGATMCILGIGIIAFWILFIFSGNMDQGIYTVENNQYIIFHQIAEITMGLLSFISGLMLINNHKKAFKLATLGIGMLLYSAINSTAHAAKNDLTLLPIFIITFIVCIMGIFVILRNGFNGDIPD